MNRGGEGGQLLNIRYHLLELAQRRLYICPRGDIVLYLPDKWGKRDSPRIGCGVRAAVSVSSVRAPRRELKTQLNLHKCKEMEFKTHLLLAIGCIGFG